MATITQLLGTDSLSSSRITLNDNFTAINDQLIDLANLLDVDSETLTITGGLNAASTLLASNSTTHFEVTASNITLGEETTATRTFILDNGFRKSVNTDTITTMPVANAYEFTTYILDATAFSGATTVNDGDEGQEITLIAEGGSISIDAGNITGPASLTINDKGTLTLRWHNDAWYIISSFNCNITVE